MNRLAAQSESRRTWQLFESRAARFFGAERAVLSGSAGRSDRSMSDSTHPTLFLECKLAATHAVRTLWDRTAKLAKAEEKTPVILLADKHKDGFLIVVHSSDWPAVVDEWRQTEGDESCSSDSGEK